MYSGGLEAPRFLHIFFACFGMGFIQLCLLQNAVFFVMYGRIVLPNLEPGTVITAKELHVPDGVVLDPTPKSIEIKGGIGGQTLTFINKSAGGLELIKVNEADRDKRIPNVTFEIRKMGGGLVDTVTTDKQGRAHLDLNAGDYYAVETEAGKGFKLDSTPVYFTIRDGKTTTLTVTNRAMSGILIHKVDSTTKKGIYGVTFLLYDASKTPSDSTAAMTRAMCISTICPPLAATTCGSWKMRGTWWIRS